MKKSPSAHLCRDLNMKVHNSQLTSLITKSYPRFKHMKFLLLLLFLFYIAGTYSLIYLLFCLQQDEKVGKECKKPLVPCVEEVLEEAITKEVIVEYPTIIDKRENIEEQSLDDSIDEAQQISMEELNERAEAFIAMFRQHLISDAKAYSYSKSCRTRTSISLKGGDKIFSKHRPIY